MASLAKKESERPSRRLNYKPLFGKKKARAAPSGGPSRTGPEREADNGWKGQQSTGSGGIDSFIITKGEWTTTEQSKTR